MKKQRSTAKIVDDIASLDVSRQRKYQLRKMRQGLCIICGDDVFKNTLFCFEHNVKRGISQPGRNKKHSSGG